MQIKKIILILLPFILVACKTDNKNDIVEDTQSLATDTIDFPLANLKDTIFFDYFMDGDGIPEEIEKSIFKRALQEYPNLREGRLHYREYAFERCPPEENTDQTIQESDKDKIFVYLCRQKNNTPEHQKVREALTGAFLTINSIYWENAHGGRGYIRMYESIPVRVEEQVFYYEPEDEYQPNYKTEKKLYIQMLKAEMVAKEAIDFELTTEDKKKSYASVYNMIDQLEKEITSRYMLKTVRRFHYTHY